MVYFYTDNADLINEKDGVDYRENIWYELAKIYQKNVIVATFTTLLHVTSDVTNTSATDAFFVEYTKRTAKDSKGLLTLQIIKNN